jgi:hypothetical protein
MRWLLLAALVVLFGCPFVRSSHAEDKRPPQVVAPDPNVCADVKAAASYVGYGYTHTITLSNGCPKAVECSVWTDVDPEPRTTLHLKPGQRADHVTRRGSPARAVTAFKSCRFR